MSGQADRHGRADERVVIAGSFRTRYLEAGAGHRDTVVLVHDGAFGADSATAWGAVIGPLAEHYRVLAPDLLGYGGTDKAVYLDRPPYDFRIDHLAAFCRAVGVASAHFVGTSFGGSLVLRAVASVSPRLPARSAVSIAGTGGPWRAPDGAAALTRFDRTREGMDRIVRLMVDDYPGLAAQVDLRFANTALPGHLEACHAARLRALAGLPGLVAPEDPWPSELAGCPVPVLLVRGARDDLLLPDWADRLATAGPHVTVQELDCRHAPNLDQPGVLVETLTDFFARRTGVGTGAEATTTSKG